MSNCSRRVWSASAAVIMTSALLSGCGTMGRPSVAAAPRCADFALQIYFAEDSATVTPAARQVIADAAAQAKSCVVAAVDVVGLADYRGPPAPNLALSRQRAEAVAGALSQGGFPAPQFRVQAVGEAGAVTAAGEVEPLRRRADIYVRFTR